jgi:1,2-diacylglycerol 3-alpha-glucosyltransferase
MRIAIFTDTFIPHVNGVVTSIINMARGLADRGHKIYIIAPRFRNFKEFSYPNITVKRTFSIPAFFYEDFKFTLPVSPKIMDFLLKENIELIHFHTPITLGFQAIVLSRLMRLPLVGSFHTFFADPQYLKHIKFNNRFMQKTAWEYSNLYFNRCNIVTCPSERSKEEIIINGCRKPVKVISNGIKTEIFDNTRSEEVKNKYNKDGKLLLFVGRISHEKNIPFLLESFKLILKQLPKTKMILVGDGPQYNDIRGKIERLNISDNVILTGKIEYDDFLKSGIYGACDLFVTASTTETQGISVLEAIANELVCVGVNGGAVPELVKNNENGFITELGDTKSFSQAIIKLLTDQKLYQKFQENSKKILQTHGMEDILNEWEKTYANLIENNK